MLYVYSIFSVMKTHIRFLFCGSYLIYVYLNEKNFSKATCLLLIIAEALFFCFLIFFFNLCKLLSLPAQFLCLQRDRLVQQQEETRQGEEVYLQATFARTCAATYLYAFKRTQPQEVAKSLHLVFNPFKLTVFSNENDNQQEKKGFFFFFSLKQSLDGVLKQAVAQLLSIKFPFASNPLFALICQNDQNLAGPAGAADQTL